MDDELAKANAEQFERDLMSLVDDSLLLDADVAMVKAALDKACALDLVARRDELIAGTTDTRFVESEDKP